MYCTGFNSHNAQDRVSGVAMIIWLGALLSARALPPSLFLCTVHCVQAVVRCCPLSTVIWLSHLPALLQCRPVLFLWLVQQREMDFQSKASPKRCLFSIPPLSQDCSFPLDLGRERFWVGIWKGRYINFDWYISGLYTRSGHQGRYVARVNNVGHWDTYVLMSTHAHIFCSTNHTNWKIINKLKASSIKDVCKTNRLE